jgi:hypothetical protein
VCQRRMDLSSEPEASRRESGDQARMEIPARWPSSVCSRVPEEADQSFMVQSEEEEAIHWPQGENFTCEMGFLWPCRIRVGV